MSQETRIAALERLGRRLNAKHSPLHILLVSGGLPGPINWAYAGQHRWRREADETLDVFAERAACAACAAGETSLVIGGLPRGDEMEEFESFESWWATIAPNYSDVPPEEKPGWTAPARRRLGSID